MTEMTAAAADLGWSLSVCVMWLQTGTALNVYPYPLCFQVFGCPIGGTLSNEKWTVDGSGSTFIWGYCDSEYRCEA